MITSLIMTVVLTASQTPAWAWTLYEGSGPVVLANERPDTPDLRSTLECVAGSGQTRVAVYEATPTPGAARLESGGAIAAVEAISTADGATAAPVRIDAPVFMRFAATGSMALTVGEQRRSIEVGAADLAKLRRFADLCRG